MWESKVGKEFILTEMCPYLVRKYSSLRLENKVEVILNLVL